ncbi:EthD family reductase [Bosea sp. (in: a-proteobacteria)]|uniref:EthD family reductase n=1 Tax=Bosea sp. (in: a-proteobacteria) TaxID=1871050 RepID=UPI002FCA78C8
MTTMYVTYAGDPDTPFDRKHWINVHFPLVRECWGPYGLERLAGFFPQGDGGGLIAIATCVFRDEAAMKAALASPETVRVMADVDLVTAVRPQRSLATPLSGNATAAANG